MSTSENGSGLAGGVWRYVVWIGMSPLCVEEYRFYRHMVFDPSANVGVLEEMKLGRERLFINPRLLRLVTSDRGEQRDA